MAPSSNPNPKSAWAIFPIGLATALSLTGDATLYSVLPTHYADAGIALASVGVILSVNRFIRLLTNGPAGWLFDRVTNRRLVFLGSLVLGIFSTMLYALTPSFEILFVARLLWGLAWSGIWIGGTAIVLQMAPPAQRGHWVGIYQMWFFFGSAVCSLAGGVLTDWVGYANGLWLGVIVATMSAVIAALTLSAQHANNRITPAITTNWRASLTLDWRGMSSAMWATAIAQGINRMATAGIVGATLGLVVQQNFGTAIHLGTVPIGVASVTGALLAARTTIGLIGAPIAGTLSDRMGGRWGLLALSLVLGGAGMAILPVPQITALIFGMLASSLSSGGVQALSTALVGDLSPAQEHGKHLAIFNIAGDLGSAIGPIIAYALLPITGLSAVYLACALLMTLTGVWSSRFGTRSFAKST